MATIKDIAKEAGVAIGTVSRVINRADNVAPATRLEVQKAIKALGYIPKEGRVGPKITKARKREGIHNGTIVFLSVAPSLSPELMHQMPAFPLLLNGIQEEVNQQGLELVLAHSAAGKSVPQILTRNKADGVLLFGYHNPEKQLKEKLQKIPAVWCFRGGGVDPEREFDHVFFDNSHVGELAARHLLKCGHRNLAYVNLRSSHSAFPQRWEQFMRTAREEGAEAVKLETDTYGLPERQFPEAEQIIEKLLQIKPFPEAVFLPCDSQMLTFYQALRQKDIEPERDLTLIGCDNDPAFTSQMHPRPATIDIKLRTVGQRAMERLLWRMAHPDDENRVEILINPVIVSPKEEKKPELKETEKCLHKTLT